MMERVAIVGVPGAGKSTLARAVGERLDLPVIHLDAEFFDPGWRPKPAEEWKAIYERLVGRERWVMDGAFAMDAALARADTIIVLDLPRRAGLLGVVRRNVRGRREQPADFAPGCRERFDRQFLRLLRFVWRYDKAGQGELEESLAKLRRDQTVVRLRSRAETAAYLETLRLR
jgi:adenylate kinase family enzyme